MILRYIILVTLSIHASCITLALRGPLTILQWDISQSFGTCCSPLVRSLGVQPRCWHPTRSAPSQLAVDIDNGQLKRLQRSFACTPPTDKEVKTYLRSHTCADKDRKLRSPYCSQHNQSVVRELVAWLQLRGLRNAPGSATEATPIGKDANQEGADRERLGAQVR